VQLLRSDNFSQHEWYFLACHIALLPFSLVNVTSGGFERLPVRSYSNKEDPPLLTLRLFSFLGLLY
jgi:hypothetical protein